MAFSLFQTVLIGVVLFSVERKLSQACFLDSLIVLLDTALDFLNAIRFSRFLCSLYLLKACLVFFMAVSQDLFHQGTTRFFPAVLALDLGMVWSAASFMVMNFSRMSSIDAFSV